MNTTEFLDDVNMSGSERLPEVPLFFEKPCVNEGDALGAAEALEPGELQFRRDFQARWWPGNMSVYTPAPKG